MIHLSDEAILEGVRLRSDFVINYVYKDYFPLIRFLVTQNGGTTEDAEDVFQDGVIIIYNMIIVGQLKLTSSFKTFMYSVCRNLWLQKLTKRKAIFDRLTDIEGYIDLPMDMLNESSYEETEMHRLIQIHFLSLPDDCQKILKMFVKKISLREIAVTMGFKSENYAKTRKYMCKEELKKRIANDPRSRKFIKNDNQL
jgi:RNA polymerase sigma factor (sigma-70 family)